MYSGRPLRQDLGHSHTTVLSKASSMPLPSGGRGGPGSAGLHWRLAPSCQPLKTQRGTEGMGKGGYEGSRPGLQRGVGPAGVEVGLASQDGAASASTHLLLCRAPTAWQNPGTTSLPTCTHALSCLLLGRHSLCTQPPPSLQPTMSLLVRHHPPPPTPSALAPGWAPEHQEDRQHLCHPHMPPGEGHGSLLSGH